MQICGCNTNLQNQPYCPRLNPNKRKLTKKRVGFPKSNHTPVILIPINTRDYSHKIKKSEPLPKCWSSLVITKAAYDKQEVYFL